MIKPGSNCPANGHSDSTMSRPILKPGKKLTYPPGPRGSATPPTGPTVSATAPSVKSTLTRMGDPWLSAINLFHPHALSMVTTSGI